MKTSVSGNMPTRGVLDVANWRVDVVSVERTSAWIEPP